MELTKMNQTIQSLEANVTTLSAQVMSLQTQLSNYRKNLTDTTGLVKDLEKNLGLLGSKESELSAKVEELMKSKPGPRKRKVEQHKSLLSEVNDTC